jgi:hypothetical protein
MRTHDSTRAITPQTRERRGYVPLDRAYVATVSAPNGARRKCSLIGGLVAAGALVDGPIDAAWRMPAFRERRTGLEQKVEASLQRGMGSPKTLPGGQATERHDPISPPPTYGPPQGSTNMADPIRQCTLAADASAGRAP